jgi:hypothetical protein
MARYSLNLSIWKPEDPAGNLSWRPDGITIIVLLGGGTKKHQQKDIDRAIELWEGYKRRKGK